jgi:hypothetical protein
MFNNFIDILHFKLFLDCSIDFKLLVERHREFFSHATFLIFKFLLFSQIENLWFFKWSKLTNQSFLTNGHVHFD